MPILAILRSLRETRKSIPIERFSGTCQRPCFEVTRVKLYCPSFRWLFVLSLTNVISSSGQSDFLENSMNALFTGWSKLSSGVEKLAQTAKQKVHELQIDDKFEVCSVNICLL